MYVYLAADDAVAALSTKYRDLSEAQAQVAEIVEIVEVADPLHSLVARPPDAVLQEIVDTAHFEGVQPTYRGYHARKTGADGTDLADYEFGEDYEPLRKFRHHNFDEKTKELIAMGFVFGSVTFSLSAEAQRNWIGLFSGRDLMTYPLTVDGKDSLDAVDLADATEVVQFYGIAMGTVEAALSSGVSLKFQVNAATSEEAILDVVDPR